MPERKAKKLKIDVYRAPLQENPREWKISITDYDSGPEAFGIRPYLILARSEAQNAVAVLKDFANGLFVDISARDWVHEDEDTYSQILECDFDVVEVPYA